ncbi:hypothetical protein FQR65_LT17314 [Abscondita terminalis]|nr:hypothetical protein FQR65_LT17314 [Abscondita terminalis]
MNEPTLKNLTSNQYKLSPEEQNFILQQLGAPHISSFNYMLNRGLNDAVANMEPIQFKTSNEDKICLRIENVSINYPLVPLGLIG